MQDQGTYNGLKMGQPQPTTRLHPAQTMAQPYASLKRRYRLALGALILSLVVNLCSPFLAETGTYDSKQRAFRASQWETYQKNKSIRAQNTPDNKTSEIQEGAQEDPSTPNNPSTPNDLSAPKDQTNANDRSTPNDQTNANDPTSPSDLDSPSNPASPNDGSNQDNTASQDDTVSQDANPNYDPEGKREIIYSMLNMDQPGTGETFVVNYFTVDRDHQQIIDYGAYSDVQALVPTESFAYTGDKIEAIANQGSFFYQGKLVGTPLPWIIDLRYFLNGTQVSPKELAGKSGALSMMINIDRNPQAEPGFYDNYMLQVVMNLDLLKVSNLKAPNATLATVGSKTMLTYMVLPGKGLHERLDADIKDFSMEAVNIMGLNMNFNLGEYTKELDAKMGQFQDLHKGINLLYEAGNQLYDGGESLSGGNRKLKDSAGLLANGLGKLSQGFGTLGAGYGQFKSGVDQYVGGVQQVGQGLDKLSWGGVAIGQGLQQLDRNGDKLLDGSDKLEAGLTQFYDGIMPLQKALPLNDLIRQFKQAKPDEMLDMLNEVIVMMNSKKPEDIRALINQLGQVKSFLQGIEDLNLAKDLDRLLGSMEDLLDSLGRIVQLESSSPQIQYTPALPPALAPVTASLIAPEPSSRATSFLTKDELEALKETLDDSFKLFQKLDTLKGTLNKLSSTNTPDYASLITDLQDQLESSTRELKELTTSIKDLLKEREDLLKKVSELEKTIESLEQDKKDLEDQIRQLEAKQGNQSANETKASQPAVGTAIAPTEASKASNPTEASQATNSTDANKATNSTGASKATEFSNSQSGSQDDPLGLGQSYAAQMAELQESLAKVRTEIEEHLSGKNRTQGQNDNSNQDQISVPEMIFGKNQNQKQSQNQGNNQGQNQSQNQSNSQVPGQAPKQGQGINQGQDPKQLQGLQFPSSSPSLGLTPSQKDWEDLLEKIRAERQALKATIEGIQGLLGLLRGQAAAFATLQAKASHYIALIDKAQTALINLAANYDSYRGQLIKVRNQLIMVSSFQKMLQGKDFNPNDFFNGVQALRDGYREFNKGLHQYVGGVQTLSENFNKTSAYEGEMGFLQGLLKLNDGIGMLSSKGSQLTQGGQDLADGIEEFQAGLNKLSDGTQQFAAGFNQLEAGYDKYLTGFGDYMDGMEQLNDETADIGEKAKEQLTGEMNKLLGSNFPIKSFVSPKNTKLSKVQFILMVPAIDTPTPPKEEEVEEKKGLLDRFLDLFRPSTSSQTASPKTSGTSTEDAQKESSKAPQPQTGQSQTAHPQTGHPQTKDSSHATEPSQR